MTSWQRHAVAIVVILSFWFMVGGAATLALASIEPGSLDLARPSLVGYLMVNVSLICLLAGVLIAVRFIHRRPVGSLISPSGSLASIHFGLLVGGYRHPAAGTTESVIAVVLVFGLLLTWTPPPWSKRCRAAIPRAARISDAESVLELIWLLLTAVLAWARLRNDLVLENLLLRHQLAVLTRPTRTRPRTGLRLWDKLVWVLARRFCPGWREHLAFVTPETVVRWHRQGWRLFWRWKSHARGGRPHLSPEVRDLITTISRENRLWGTERIRGELLKLGIIVSNRSIRRYRWRGPRRPSSQTWRTFLHNHAHHPWAADLFTVPNLTFKTLYVLVFIAHGRRELVHVSVTANPTAAWVWRQLIEATPWGQKPRHLLRDRDAVYGRDLRQRARRIGIDAIATPIHAPTANAIAERVIGTLRRECLDHMIVFDEHHPSTVLHEFMAYYNQARPHRTLRLQTPELRPRPVTGPIRSRPVLNGLHHVYERAA